MTTAGATEREPLGELEQAVHSEPTSGSAWGVLGRAYQDAGAHELARTAFEQAVRFCPDTPMHWFGLGRARLETGDLQGALEAARRAVELAPDGRGRAAAPGPGLRAARRRSARPSSTWRRRCGSTRSGRRPSPISAGRRWPWATTPRPGRRSRPRCASTPTSRPCGRRSADACSSRGGPTNAVHVLETAVFERPADGVAWARLGCAYFETGRHAEAARAFTRGFEHGEDEPWAWYWAGRNAAALGDGEALDRSRRELKERDAELLRELEARVEAIVAQVPCSTPPPAAEEPSC